MSEPKRKANTDTTYCIKECSNKCWRQHTNYEFEKILMNWGGYWFTNECIEGRGVNMTYKGNKIRLKDFIVGVHEITMRTISWTSSSWLDILEDIFIKLSIIVYPFKYIYYSIIILIEIIRNGKKGGSNNATNKR